MARRAFNDGEGACIRISCGTPRLLNGRGELRLELPPDPLNIAQHPQLDDFAVATFEKCRAAPADFSPARRDAEKSAAMAAMKSHARRRVVGGGDHLLDLARETAERVVHRSHIGDKPVRSAQFRTKRTSKTKVAVENSARFGLVSLVPNVMIKPFYELSRG